MKKVWHYQGASNLENGGSFYCLENLPYGYAEAIRVYPCGDAGAQDNCWWVDEHTVNLPDESGVITKALHYCGLELHHTDATSLQIVAALHEYGKYEQDSSTTVQIGPDDPHYNGFNPVKPYTRLRAGIDLEKWVRREYKLGRKR